MNQVVLRKRPWISKDNQLIVGGTPPKVIELTHKHQIEFEELLESKKLNVTEKNQELIEVLINSGIIRPLHTFTKEQLDSVTDKIEIVFSVSSCTSEAIKSAAQLIRGDSPFPLDQITFVATSEQLSTEFISKVGEPVSVLIEPLTSHFKIAVDTCKAEIVVLMTNEVQISSTDLRLLALEMLEDKIDVLIPRTIGAYESANLGTLGSLIAHFEETQSLTDSGSNWGKNTVSNRLKLASTPILLTRRDLVDQLGGIFELTPVLAVAEFTGRAAFHGKEVVFEPGIIARQSAPKTIPGFIKSAYNQGLSDSQLAFKYPYTQTDFAVNLPHLVSLAGPMAFGIRGLSAAALNESLFLANAGQKLAKSKSGDAAAIEFTIRSIIESVNEISFHFRRRLSGPLLLLVPFSKISRRIYSTLAITQLIQSMRFISSAEIIPNAVAGWIQDISYSFGVWTGALSNRSPKTALPKPKQVRIRNSK